MAPELPHFLPNPSYQHVNVTDPMEVARWSWLLDVDDAQIRHAVSMVGPNGEAVTDYIDNFSRPMRRVH